MKSLCVARLVADVLWAAHSCSLWRFSTKWSHCNVYFPIPFPFRRDGQIVPCRTTPVAPFYALTSTELQSIVNTSTAQAHLHDFLL